MWSLSKLEVINTAFTHCEPLVAFLALHAVLWGVLWGKDIINIRVLHIEITQKCRSFARVMWSNRAVTTPPLACWGKQNGGPTKRSCVAYLSEYTYCITVFIQISARDDYLIFWLLGRALFREGVLLNLDQFSHKDNSTLYLHIQNIHAK